MSQEQQKQQHDDQVQPGTKEMNPGDEAPQGTPGTGDNVCRACGGTGRQGNQACPTCGGTGVVTEAVGGA